MTAVDPDGRAARPSPRLPRVLTAVAGVWVIGVVASSVFVPVRNESTYTITSGSDVVAVSESTSPLISAELPVKVAVAATAVLATTVLVMWARRPGRFPRNAVLVAGWVSAVFCFLTGFSIGLFFLPVPPLLFAAAAWTPPKERRRRPARLGRPTR